MTPCFHQTKPSCTQNRHRRTRTRTVLCVAENPYASHGRMPSSFYRSAGTAVVEDTQRRRIAAMCAAITWPRTYAAAGATGRWLSRVHLVRVETVSLEADAGQALHRA